MWFLQFGDREIVSLTIKRQTNPVYLTKPGHPQAVGTPLADNCRIETTALRFEFGQFGGKVFLSAEVDIPQFAVHGWVTVWQGVSWDRPCALFCATGYDRSYGSNCLCGSCPM